MDKRTIAAFAWLGLCFLPAPFGTFFLCASILLGLIVVVGILTELPL